MIERLQKIISRAGIASRRHAEQLILSGAVTVNGHVVTELGTKADAARDHITVGPRVVRVADEKGEMYFAFHKPQQVVSTMNDPEGRPCLSPYLRGHKQRLIPVGRLEFDSGGLLLLTSDGALASDLMRAAGAITQTWRFKVKGRITSDVQRVIEREARARVRTHREGENAWYEATLRNAPRDLLRLTLQRQGILLEKMVRSGFAGIELDSLPPGEMRELTPAEVNAVRRAAQGREEPVKPSRDKAAKPVRFRKAASGRGAMANAVENSRSARRREPSHVGRTERRGERRRAPGGRRHS